MRADAAAVAACLLACAAMAAAALPPDLARQLSRMPEPLQRQLLQREARLVAMPATTRAALQARREHWDALPLDERSRLREHWRAWQSLPPAQQAQVRDAAQAFSALPPERQRALRLRFQQLPADAQRGWLLGPAAGAAWPQLQPLLLQVPGSERAPLLQTLRSMSADELRDLGVLAQRTPPQERDALRRELVRTSDDNRGAWLRLRLER